MPILNTFEYYKSHITQFDNIQVQMPTKQVLPKIIWEECVTLTQLHNTTKSHIGYNGVPQIHP